MEKQNYQNFLVSIIVVLIFPLMPIIMELAVKLSCLDTTLVLTAALYSVTVLTTSKSPAYIFVSFIPCMLFSGIYVNLLNKEIVTPEAVQPHSFAIIGLTIVSVIAIGFLHGAERYNRHVKGGEPFVQFYQ